MTSTTTTTTTKGSEVEDEVDEVDDLALAQLIEAFGDAHDVNVIARALRESNGDVGAAASRLLLSARQDGDDSEETRSTLGKRRRSPSPELLHLRPSQKKQSALDQLKWKEGTTPQPPILLTPKNLSAHVPCEIFLDFLDAELADACLRVLMEESKTWRQPRFVINEREVYSNHSSAFYAADPSEVGQSWYGDQSQTHPFSKEMMRVKDAVQDRVRERVKDLVRDDDRGRGEVSLKRLWTANAAVANRYSTGNETTGAHADRLTYIGPKPIIASVTLGAGRHFRLKRLPRPPSVPAQTFNVLLPHNSLLIMYPPTQEDYKHEVPPMQSKFIVFHRITGECRFNLTFRDYRREFREPPICKCGSKMELKPVLKSGDALGKYYFTCTYGRSDKTGPGEVLGCGAFHWLDESRVPRGRICLSADAIK